jgi:two-component system nitrate/nitrite response regulator NarL
MRRILLVEDHASFRQTLALVFDQQPEFEVVAQAGTLAETRRKMDGFEADLGVIDLTLPDGEGTELIAADVDTIIDATRRIGEGETLLSEDELIALLRLAGQNREQKVEARASIEQITPREKEVLQKLAEGLSNKEIAASLHMSVDTERTHMMNILNKLGVHSRLQALVFAARHGLVEIR